MGSLSLLQGIFPSQGSSLGLPHCRQILYQLSHREADIKAMVRHMPGRPAAGLSFPLFPSLRSVTLDPWVHRFLALGPALPAVSLLNARSCDRPSPPVNSDPPPFRRGVSPENV